MTLLEAMVTLYNHNDKAKLASFELLFKGVERKSSIAKGWDKQKKEWVYSVHSTHEPAFAYTEETILSAIAGISGVPLFFNRIDFHISDEVEYTDINRR